MLQPNRASRRIQTAIGGHTIESRLSPSLSNNPKNLNNYLIFTDVDDEDEDEDEDAVYLVRGQKTRP